MTVVGDGDRRQPAAPAMPILDKPPRVLGTDLREKADEARELARSQGAVVAGLARKHEDRGERRGVDPGGAARDREPLARRLEDEATDEEKRQSSQPREEGLKQRHLAL